MLIASPIELKTQLHIYMGHKKNHLISYYKGPYALQFFFFREHDLESDTVAIFRHNGIPHYCNTAQPSTDVLLLFAQVFTSHV